MLKPCLSFTKPNLQLSRLCCFYTAELWTEATQKVQSVPSGPPSFPVWVEQCWGVGIHRLFLQLCRQERGGKPEDKEKPSGIHQLQQKTKMPISRPRISWRRTRRNRWSRRQVPRTSRPRTRGQPPTYVGLHLGNDLIKTYTIFTSEELLIAIETFKEYAYITFGDEYGA